MSASELEAYKQKCAELQKALDEAKQKNSVPEIARRANHPRNKPPRRSPRRHAGECFVVVCENCACGHEKECVCDADSPKVAESGHAGECFVFMRVCL